MPLNRRLLEWLTAAKCTVQSRNRMKQDETGLGMPWTCIVHGSTLYQGVRCKLTHLQNYYRVIKRCFYVFVRAPTRTPIQTYSLDSPICCCVLILAVYHGLRTNERKNKQRKMNIQSVQYRPTHSANLYQFTSPNNLTAYARPT